MSIFIGRKTGPFLMSYTPHPERSGVMLHTSRQSWALSASLFGRCAGLVGWYYRKHKGADRKFQYPADL